MSKARRNLLDRRADKLSDEMKRKENSVFQRLTDPAPAFQVRKNEIDALRDYMRVRANPDGLKQLRSSFGGPYRDEDVDAYVAWGENAMAKYMPYMMGRGQLPDPDQQPEWTDTPTFNGGGEEGQNG